MPSLTVRDLPEDTMSTIRMRAARHHRSLNGEILHIFATVASFGDAFEFPIRPAADSREAHQRAAILELAGQWEDPRPIEDKITDIESARTPGREVVL